MSVRCGNEAVQIMGGYGYTKEYMVEKEREMHGIPLNDKVVDDLGSLKKKFSI